jgi:hypothetical protein
VTDSATPRLELSSLEIATPAGPRQVLVVTPLEMVRVGKARLARIRDGDADSPVDEEIVRGLTSSGRTADALVLRSWGGSPERSWGFADELDEHEVRELGYAMMRGQLALFRRVLALGVRALVSTDLTAREFDAFRVGGLRLARELQGGVAAGARGSTDEIDLWILDHFSLWTTRPFDEFVLQGLPPLFTLVDRHADELASFRSRLAG